MRRTMFLTCVVALGLCATPLCSQVITTVAGGGWRAFPTAPVPALGAALGTVWGPSIDGRGNIYFADSYNNIVVRVSPSGSLVLVAGNSHAGFSGDGGPANSASLNFPTGVAVDSSGDLYIADYNNNRIRKVSGGTITTVAGSADYGFFGDGGPATGAWLYRPVAVALDNAGNLYIADQFNHRIREVSGGIINTVAGNGTGAFSGDGGPATSASLNNPHGIALDSAGNLYIADYDNNRVRMVSGGTMTTVAGNGTYYFSGDGGLATSATLARPEGVVVDAAGNLFIADFFNERIREVSGGIITTVVGDGYIGFAGDGGSPALAALDGPAGVAVDTAGDLYIADFFNERIREVSGGIINTVAGSGGGTLWGDGGSAAGAALLNPVDVVADQKGNLYIADFGNNCVRKVSGGTITRVAGNGVAGFSGDGGLATGASLNGPTGLALDGAGNLFIADELNQRIREVSNGIITTVAGNGVGGYAGDGGTAVNASLLFPFRVAVDAFGNLYIADSGNNVVREVSGGTIATVAGSGLAGFSGDGGPALLASLSNPEGIAVDALGNLFIADEMNQRIREVSGGTIITIAGTGFAGFSGDGGPAISASLDDPAGVAVDAAGDILIADDLNNCIRVISGGTINTIAGDGVAAFSGDGGAAVLAELSNPAGVAVDSTGNLYIADTYNYRIRAVLENLPSYQAAPGSLSFSALAGGTPGAQGISLSSAVPGLGFTASASATWLSVSPSSGTIPTVLSVSASAANLAAGTYRGTVTVTAPNANPSTITVSVTFVVQAAMPAALGTDTRNVGFTAIQGGAPLTQQMHVLNTGGGSLSFTTSAKASSSVSWLTVSPASGTASPSSPASLTVTATPGSLSPGTYSGAITVTSAGSSISITVTLSVSAPTASILVSQSGLSFTVVAQGGLPLPQTFGILNVGQGAMSWTAAATTLSGGNWLQISPASGTVQQAYLDVSSVTVSINPNSLGAGTYYGKIQVSAAAANTPQVMTVILTVLPPGLSLGPQLFPTGLIFTGVAGVTPAYQDVQVGNPTAQGNSFQSGQIGAGFSFLPANASIQPSQPTTLRVFPDFSQLSAGSIQRGTVTLQFSDGSPAQNINILIVVAPAGATAAAGLIVAPHDNSGCASQGLQVLYRSLQPNFVAVLGQGTSLEVQVSDGCGNLIGPGGQSAQVSALFSDNDPTVAMTHIGNGIWQGTWKPLNAGPVAVEVEAFEQQGGSLVGGHSPALSGVVSAPAPAATTPTVTAQGVVQSASGQPGVPIAPGGLITVYGVNLSDAAGQSKSLPLPQELNGTQVLLGNQPLPILYTSAGQLNVQVPFGVPVNTPYQLTVQHGMALSVPQALAVAPAQPGIFTLNQQGTGQGSIVKSDGVTLAEPGTPANIGETVVIYCTGLGQVTPPVKEGTPAPTTPPLSTTVNAVTVTIGGQAAPVAFAGLTPGYAGLYQVNAVVPAGIATGDAVPVVLSVAGQTSPPVMIAVQ